MQPNSFDVSLLKDVVGGKPTKFFPVPVIKTVCLVVLWVILYYSHIFRSTSFIYFSFYFSDYALPGYSGGGGPGRGGKEGDGRNPAVCLDRPTPAKTDMERQVTQCTNNMVLPLDTEKEVSDRCARQIK